MKFTRFAVSGPSPPMWPHSWLLFCEQGPGLVAVHWSANQHPR